MKSSGRSHKEVKGKPSGYGPMSEDLCGIFANHEREYRVIVTVFGKFSFFANF